LLGFNFETSHFLWQSARFSRFFASVDVFSSLRRKKKPVLFAPFPLGFLPSRQNSLQ